MHPIALQMWSVRRAAQENPAAAKPAGLGLGPLVGLRSKMNDGRNSELETGLSHNTTPFPRSNLQYTAYSTSHFDSAHLGLSF